MTIILHVFVVGFHHRRGCQVDYCYPPLDEKPLSVDNAEGKEVEMPSEWSNLPTLALPDGAHNVKKDSVYFHLPAIGGTNETVFGVSCYRQIETEKLLKKSVDVTRCSVQKSVCVLSRIPLYGLIKAKLEVITEAYFNECNFEQVEVLAEMYDSLCSTITQDLLESQALLGLSVRSLILEHRHKVLVLFKLLLLEKRVLFHLFPVEKLCQTLLSTVSLFPGMIEHGLANCATYIPIPGCMANEEQQDTTDQSDSNPEHQSAIPNKSPAESPSSRKSVESSTSGQEDVTSAGDSLKMEQSLPGAVTTDGNSLESPNDFTHESVDVNAQNLPTSATPIADSHMAADPQSKNTKNVIDPQENHADFEGAETAVEANLSDSSWLGSSNARTVLDSSYNKLTTWKQKFGSSISSLTSPSSDDLHELDQETLSKSSSTPSLSSKSAAPDPKDLSAEEKAEIIKNYSTLEADEYGFPLSIFTKGSLCHPYLSLAYIDWLSAVNVRSYVFGATNHLFRQRKRLLDVAIYHDEDGALQIDIQDPELRREMTLSTADLRFADYLVKNVAEITGDVFVDDTESAVDAREFSKWEGSDEWIRLQFRYYLLALISTVKSDNVDLITDFNLSFVKAWKTTHNYRIWACSHLPRLNDAVPGHTFRGQMNMSDVKLKVSHSLQVSDSGRKLTQTVNQCEKYVAQTGKAVEGALSNAKSAVSTWWTGGTASSPGESERNSVL